jgi:hypothetical protein
MQASADGVTTLRTLSSNNSSLNPVQDLRLPSQTQAHHPSFRRAARPPRKLDRIDVEVAALDSYEYRIRESYAQRNMTTPRVQSLFVDQVWNTLELWTTFADEHKKDLDTQCG